MGCRQWRTRSLRVLCGCLLPASLAISACPLFATEFDFGVDRLEIDGNGYGPSDGIPDLVAEFHDGWLGPDWASISGTVRAEGGALHLASPGSLVANGFGALPGTTLEISMVQFQRPVGRGQGGFMAKSFWAPMSLRVGDFDLQPRWGRDVPCPVRAPRVLPR